MYTIDRVNDFVHLNWLDKRYANFEKMSFAIFPHAPSVSDSRVCSFSGGVSQA